MVELIFGVVQESEMRDDEHGEACMVHINQKESDDKNLNSLFGRILLFENNLLKPVLCALSFY
jgi:hypothetical protein